MVGTGCVEHDLIGDVTIMRRTSVSTSCRRAAATMCPRPGLQRKHAAAAWATPAEPGTIGQYAPAGRPYTPPADRMYATDVRQTDVRQHQRLMTPGREHNNGWNVANDVASRTLLEVADRQPMTGYRWCASWNNEQYH